MAKYLRIIFTILCAVCIAALIPLGMFLGWAGVGYCFFGAVAYFVLMLLCKQTQELQELKEKNANVGLDNGSADGADNDASPIETDGNSVESAENAQETKK